MDHPQRKDVHTEKDKYGGRGKRKQKKNPSSQILKLLEDVMGSGVGIQTGTTDTNIRAYRDVQFPKLVRDAGLKKRNSKNVVGKKRSRGEEQLPPRRGRYESRPKAKKRGVPSKGKSGGRMILRKALFPALPKNLDFRGRVRWCLEAESSSQLRCSTEGNVYKRTHGAKWAIARRREKGYL